MKRITTTFKIAMAAAGGFLLLQTASAQTFTYTNNDLALGFRKTGSFQGSYEVVVDIGQASNYFNLSVGTTIPVPGFTASQLTPGTFNNLSNLSWSVFGYYSGSGFGASYPSSVGSTLWVTVPRTDSGIKSTDATRLTKGAQASARSPIKAILDNAAFVSAALGSSGTYNTATFVRESIADYPDHLLTVWMKSLSYHTVGTLNDAWPEGNLEITTPGNFTNAVRSDLYEVRPLTDSQGNAIVDPHTGTSSIAWYVGYFQFNPDGTMTFTRDVPQTTLSLARAGNVNTITFPSYSYVTYKLFATNSAGLTAPVTSWPSSSPISGTGNTITLTPTTTDTTLFYIVKEQ